MNAIRNTQGDGGHPLSRLAFLDLLNDKWRKRGARYGVTSFNEQYFRASEEGTRNNKPYPLSYPLLEAYANALSMPLASILLVSRLTASKKHVDDVDAPKTPETISPEEIIAGMRALCDFYESELKNKKIIANHDIRRFLEAFNPK